MNQSGLWRTLIQKQGMRGSFYFQTHLETVRQGCWCLNYTSSTSQTSHKINETSTNTTEHTNRCSLSQRSNCIWWQLATLWHHVNMHTSANTAQRKYRIYFWNNNVVKSQDIQYCWYRRHSQQVISDAGNRNKALKTCVHWLLQHMSLSKRLNQQKKYILHILLSL